MEALGNLIHRIFRGHWFVPKFVEHDQRVGWGRKGPDPITYAPVFGCEVCFDTNPLQYYRDLHNAGICQKELLGYFCKGRPGECYPRDVE